MMSSEFGLRSGKSMLKICIVGELTRGGSALQVEITYWGRGLE